MKYLHDKHKNQLLVFLLLFFSGNPLTKILGDTAYIYALIALLLIFKLKKIFSRLLFIFYAKVVFILLLIFSFQYLILGFVSWLGVFNFLLKVFIGATVVYNLGEKFQYYFFVVLYKICVISLVGYIFINIMKVDIPGVKIDEAQTSYFLYGFTQFHPFKNEGMFWEPGAYAGIITLCLILNFKNLAFILNDNKYKLLIIFITLLTTRSTTGYLVGCIILLAFCYSTNKKLLIYLLPIAMLLFGYIYTSVDFLGDKISDQYNNASNLSKNEFSNTRFGSLVFDWEYFKKHPVIGNGLHEKTRYADHPDILLALKSGEGLGHGNGFSNSLASMGIVFILGFFALIYNVLSKETFLYSILVIGVIILNLQGEPWFNYPLYLGLPFLRNRYLSNY